MSAQAARVRAPDVGMPDTRTPDTRVPAAREGEPPRRSRPQLTVAPPLPVSAPRTPFVVLVLAVVAVGVLGILLINTRTNEDAFTLHELRQEQAALDQRQQELERRIAEADSTANLTAAARRLGLVQVPADERVWIRLPGGEVVGDPVPVAEEPNGSQEG